MPKNLGTISDPKDIITKEYLEDKLSEKVDKIDNKGLSTNDFTDEDKLKLEGIASGAEANVQPNWDEDNPESDAFIQNKPIAKNTTLISLSEYTEEDMQAMWDSVFV